VNAFMNLALALLFMVTGFAWTLFPQWFYKKVTRERQARNRKRFQLFGVIILVLGLTLLGIEAMKLK